MKDLFKPTLNGMGFETTKMILFPIVLLNTQCVLMIGY